MAQTNSLFLLELLRIHIRAPGGDLSTVFPVNTKANNRARTVDLLEKKNMILLSILEMWCIPYKI